MNGAVMTSATRRLRSLWHGYLCLIVALMRALQWLPGSGSRRLAVRVRPASGTMGQRRADR